MKQTANTSSNSVECHDILICPKEHALKYMDQKENKKCKLVYKEGLMWQRKKKQTRTRIRMLPRQSAHPTRVTPQHPRRCWYRYTRAVAPFNIFKSPLSTLMFI